jgi:hypothetical protein
VVAAAAQAVEPAVARTIWWHFGIEVPPIFNHYFQKN